MRRGYGWWLGLGLFACSSLPPAAGGPGDAPSSSAALVGVSPPDDSSAQPASAPTGVVVRPAEAEPSSHVAWIKVLGSSRAVSLNEPTKAWSDGDGFIVSSTQTVWEGVPDAPGELHDFVARLDASAAHARLLVRFSRGGSWQLTARAARPDGGSSLLIAHGGGLESGRVKLPPHQEIARLAWLQVDPAGQGVKARDLGSVNPALLEAAADAAGNFYILSGQYADSPTLRAGAMFRRHELTLRKVNDRGGALWSRHLALGGYSAAGGVLVSGERVVASYGSSNNPEVTTLTARVEGRDPRGKVGWSAPLLTSALTLDRQGNVLAFVADQADPKAHVAVTLSPEGKELRRWAHCCGEEIQAVALPRGVAVLLLDPVPYSPVLLPPTLEPTVTVLDDAGAVLWTQTLSARALGLPERTTLRFSERALVATADGAPLLVGLTAAGGVTSLVAIKLKE